jgi:hypothetical protein
LYSKALQCIPHPYVSSYTIYTGRMNMEEKFEYVDKKFGRGVEGWIEGMKEGTYE